MKKRYLSLFFIPLLTMSCAEEIPFAFYQYSNIASMVVKTPVDNEQYYRLREYKNINYIDYETGEEELIDSYRTVYSSTNLTDVFLNQCSLGDQKILIVPVCFKGQTVQNKIEKNIYLQNAFFGNPDKTGFESVASFYNKSSYGQLRISGEITDWYHADYALTDDLSDYNQISKKIAISAVDWLKSEQYTGPKIDLESYDLDKDKYIDSVYLVYDAPYDASCTDSIFWAFTNHTKRGEFSLNNTAPYVCSFSWSSINFVIQEENQAQHNTFIHEVGHLLGLSDYYSNISSYQPTGSFDVMDSNLGDQSGYSKMILNWVTPYVLKKEGRITLRPFSSTGDLLLVPVGTYNDTPYDEYLLLEYFTSDGLNSTNGASYEYKSYDGERNIFKYPSYHGVKVYHIDSRIAYLSRKNVGTIGNSIIAYLDEENALNKAKDYGKYCIGIGNTNQVLGQKDKVLCHLLESSGLNTFLNGKTANNDTLFRLNSSFGVETFTDYKFNKVDSNGKNYRLEYTFKIVELHSDSVTIEFTKK